MSPALNITFALPAIFLAVIVKVASPFSSVTELVGETDMRLLPDLLTVAVTVAPSTRQLFSPVAVTVTFSLSFFLSFSVFGDTDKVLDLIALNWKCICAVAEGAVDRISRVFSAERQDANPRLHGRQDRGRGSVRLGWYHRGCRLTQCQRHIGAPRPDAIAEAIFPCFVQHGVILGLAAEDPHPLIGLRRGMECAGGRRFLLLHLRPGVFTDVVSPHLIEGNFARLSAKDKHGFFADRGAVTKTRVARQRGFVQEPPEGLNVQRSPRGFAAVAGGNFPPAVGHGIIFPDIREKDKSAIPCAKAHVHFVLSNDGRMIP